jgi:hypothetical protein
MAAARLGVVAGRLGHGEEAVEHEAGLESVERPAHERRASGRSRIRALGAVHMSLAVEGVVGVLEEMEDGAAHRAFPEHAVPISSSSGEVLGMHISSPPPPAIQQRRRDMNLARGC